MIPYGRQKITDADIVAVREVLESDFLTQGPQVPMFENAIGRKIGVKRVVAANSATSALHLACLALGLGEGDRLWTTPISFVASANCGLYCGATVDFVDIDPFTLNISIDALEQKLDLAKVSGTIPKVLVVVHFAGLSCDMREIGRLREKFGFKVIEDGSHAIGGRYLDSYVGNCAFSDVAIFSFHPVKIITCGEGGVAVTNDDEVADTMVMLRSHGITRDALKMDVEPEGDWFYQQLALGFNYRMTDIQAALGRSQLLRLDEIIMARNEIAERYRDLLSGVPVSCQSISSSSLSAYHLFVVWMNESGKGIDRASVFSQMKQNGIGVNVHYIPIHLHPYYQDLGFKLGDYPNAERYYASALTLPLFPELNNDDQRRIVETLRSALD